MKIAQIVCSYPPYYGGMGNVVFQTAAGLANLGHQVQVLTPQFLEKKEIKPVTEPVEKKHTKELQSQIDYAKRLKPSIRYGNAARLPQIQSELDEFDLVHLHYPFFGTANLVRRWKLRNPDKPLVITYHMDSRSGGWKGLIFSYYAKYWMPKILGTADKLIASSFDYIESSDAREIFAKKPEKWLELPFGVDAERFSPRAKPEYLFQQYGLDMGQPTVLFVGGMDTAHYFKGVKYFLEAILFLQKKNINLQAVLVGDGDLKVGFEQLARSFDLKNTVFAGSVSDSDLPAYYNMADLLVLPSINKSEAFGMVLLEAMASGVPVIASNLPGVRSVAADGGVLVEPGNYQDIADAIQGFFMSDGNREEWRQDVRSIVEQKYSLEQVTNSLDWIYRSLVS